MPLPPMPTVPPQSSASIYSPKRQRTAALQNAGAPSNAPKRAKRLGVRLSSAAFESARFLPILCAASAALLILSSGCSTPIGAEKTSTARAYRQTHENAVSHDGPGVETRSVLTRFDQEKQFTKSPDATLLLIHQKAVESGERDLLFALSELNYLAGERLRRSAKPREPRDARDYYLASAVYAWFFLFGDTPAPSPSAFDQRFRTACDLYNFGLGWALTGRGSTNVVAFLAGGTRKLPVGQIDITFSQPGFPWPLEDVQGFVVSDQLLVRGLSARNRTAGLGAPLVAVSNPNGTELAGLSRTFPSTVLLRLSGPLSDLAQGKVRGSLELYATFEPTTIALDNRTLPLESDTTVPLAYSLNQSLFWRLGKMQFLSAEEKVRSDVYLGQPYQPGRVPVVFVHGTFSSPIWWGEMVNTLRTDPVISQRCQFWQFIYNSGNPTLLSALKLREALTAKIKQLDPEGKDPALRQMVVIGHSQGGLLTKLTATDTGDKLWQSVLKTNSLGGFNMTDKEQALIRSYTCYEALPFVKGVVFISTPHRGSYLSFGLARALARKLVTFPARLADRSKEFMGLTEKLDLPKELRGSRTSLDSMSIGNPLMLALADIPLAPGVKGHSIIAVKGKGDYHEGADGLVRYKSAHIDYAASECIVRGPHSCQAMPATIEEVRRILREHVASLPANVVSRPAGNP
jgi:pimeloyl-ACP methyl ester carboxylesterase